MNARCIQHKLLRHDRAAGSGAFPKRHGAMKRARLTRFALFVLGAIATTITIATTPTSACSLWLPYETTVEELRSSAADLNDPNGQLAIAYSEYSGQPMPEITGAYARDTIDHVDATEKQTRGSVSVLTHTWGDPDSPNPIATHEPSDADECGSLNGPATGTRTVRLVTTDGSIVIADGEGAEADLDEIFGNPIPVERDADAEAAAVASIQPGPRPLLIGIAVTIVGLAVLAMSRIRQRKTDAATN